MTLIPLITTELATQQAYARGFDHVKQAGDATSTLSLSGRLYASSSGWLLLSVPNAIVRGLFDALDEPGIELPSRNTNDAKSTLNAHVSIMTADEVESLGGVDKISERGHSFRYQLGPIKTVAPKTWNGVSRVWYCTVLSPELRELRRSYGLSPQPHGDWDFHITVAIRKSGILGTNPIRKAADSATCPADQESEKLLEAAGAGKTPEQLVGVKPPGQPDEVAKLAAHQTVLKYLQEAKLKSDQHDYAGKHAILQEVMRKDPAAWQIDKQGRMAGVTHTPTGFKFHMPVGMIVPGIQSAHS